MTLILSSFRKGFLPLISWQTLKSMLCVSTLMLSAAYTLAQTPAANGIGEYTEFGKPTLLIKLDMGVPTDNASDAISLDVPKQLSFRLLEDRTARRWSQVWIQNLSINSPPAQLTKQTDDLIKMTQAIPAGLKQGDLVEFERAASDLTIMMVDGIELASFETEGFFEFLLSAFIGPIPPSSDLKSRLLGGGQIDNDAMSLFSSLGYSQDRSNEIAAWIEPEEPEEIAVAAVEEVVEEVVEETPVAETAAPAETTVAVAEVVEEVVAEVVESAPEVAVVNEQTEKGEARGPGSQAGSKAGSRGDGRPKPEVAEEDAPVIITAESLLAVQNYQRQMLTKIYQNIRYPASAERRNREGSLRISVAVNRDGTVNKVDVTEAADFDGFNKAAITAVDKASPFTDLPEAVMELPMIVEIPIQFRLQ